MTQSCNSKASFVGDVLKLVGGTTFVQILSILVAPILAWLYTPEAFGIAALFASIIAVTEVISTLSYDGAIMLPETDEEAVNLLGVSVVAVIIISLLTAIVILFGQTLIAGWLGASELAPYLWLLPPVIFANGLFWALRAWNSRTKHFGRLAIADASASLSGSGAKLGAGLTGYVTAGSLIGGNALGSVISTAVLGGQIWRDDRHLITKSINWRDMLDGLKRYRKFPLFSTWSALLNRLSWQLPVFVLSMFFSPAVVGFYSLGNRVVRLPMVFVGGSIGRVFYQRAAEAHNTGNLSSVVLPVYRRLAAYGLFPMLFLTLTGKELFILVFGQTWAEAGVYTQILSIYMFFVFISSPIGILFNVLEKQEVAVFVNTLLLLSRAGTLWLGGITGNVIFTLILFSLSGVLVYGGFSMYILHAAGVPLRGWWITLLHSMLISGIFLAPGWLLIITFQLQSWAMLVTYGLCAAAYYIWVLLKDKQLMSLFYRFYPRLHGLVNR